MMIRKESLNWPLMSNNISGDDLKCLIKFLETNPRLTQASQVSEFEKEWSEWLGVKYSVFVNSGSSANILTLAAIRHLYGTGEIILPPLTWVSDVVAVIHNGFTPVFADINPRTLSLDDERVIEKITDKTLAVFLTHAQGFNGLTDRLINALNERGIMLIEDVCEAHGSTFNGQKNGTHGLVSNFSFYYAHHMSTVEGGMVCTDDESVYQVARMLRSHGMVREATNDKLKNDYMLNHPDLSPDFIFAYPGFNFRNSEIGAVIGRNQLKRLDGNNEIRNKNFSLFLENLNPEIYRTDFELTGCCNYAFNLVMKHKDPDFRDRVEKTLDRYGVEYRRGSSGGGNQLRQPYLKRFLQENEFTRYPEVEHIHFYGFYIGNYPELSPDKIFALCNVLNHI